MKTQKRQLIDILFQYGLSISYRWIDSEIFGEDNNNNNDTGDVENDDFGSFPEDDSNIWTEYLLSVSTSKTYFYNPPPPIHFYTVFAHALLIYFSCFFLKFNTMISENEEAAFLEDRRFIVG